jgi:ATP-dependent Clp protease adaptor protein ClpS
MATMGKQGSDSQTIERTTVRTKTPKQFKVILLNDDYTTMDFVVEVLEQVFQRSPAEATQIMLAVHKQGRGIAGIYPKDIAEAKIDQVHKFAEVEGHPLQCVLEEA